MPNPSIFISATSSDLHSARDLVADVLNGMAYQPVWQDIAATAGGDLVDILRDRIAPCSAVIQLVGMRYGAEPAAPNAYFLELANKEKVTRLSYTQFEALHAKQVGKTVIYVVLPPDFPTDPCFAESDELAQHQLAYRKRLASTGELRHTAANLNELEIRILRFRDDLGEIRKRLERGQRRLWIAAVLSFMVLIAISVIVWNLSGSAKKQELTLGDLRHSTEMQGQVVSRIDGKVEQIRGLSAAGRSHPVG